MSEKEMAVGKTTKKYKVVLNQGEWTTTSEFTKEEILERIDWWLFEFKNVKIEESL